MQANGTPRLSAEMIAVSDALRHIRSRLESLTRMGHPNIAGDEYTVIVLIESPVLAAALDHLAEVLAINE